MPRPNRLPKSLTLHLTLPAINALMVTIGIAGMSAAQEGNDADPARAERAAQLDSKMSALRDQFKLLKAKLGDASDQAQSNLSAELEIAKRELGKVYDEKEAAYQASLLKWSESIDATWKELEDQGLTTKADATKKLQEIRDAWNASYDQLRQSHQERVELYRDELTSIEKQVADASDDLNAEWIARRTAARKQYEQTAAAMRTSYQQSIESLGKEVERLQTAANKARGENKAKFNAMADSLSEQMNDLQQELQSSYRETAEKANSYLDQTKAKLALAGADAKAAIETEADQVSTAACELNAEMVASCEQYSQSLDTQLASLKRRTTAANAEAKQTLQETEAKLRVQSEKATEQAQQAYSSYVAALNADIDHMKQRLADAEGRTKTAIIESIERRQADLEKVKTKLNRTR